MTTLAIRKKLVNYMQVAEDKKIKAVYALLEDDMKQGKRISINQYNKEIEAAMKEITKGDIYSHEEVVKLSKKW
jgi:uncharacterized protein (DUF2344 family)